MVWKIDLGTSQLLVPLQAFNFFRAENCLCTFPRRSGHAVVINSLQGSIEIDISCKLGTDTDLSSQDQDLMGNEDILHFWERDVKEALQQQCAFPMAEELILLVNNWGFNLGSLPFNEREGRSLLRQVVGLFQSKERRRIFSGPIHIWQVMAFIELFYVGV